MSQSMLAILAAKLGIDQQKLLKKAEELKRLSEVRNISNARLVNINETSKLVLMLDLAAMVHGIPLNRAQAITFAGISKRNYMTNLQIMQEMLSLGRKVTINDLCIQLGCIGARYLAEEILEKYEKSVNATGSLDTKTPMFLVAAVCVACKQSKIKIGWSKCLELGRVHRAMLNKLMLEMAPFATQAKESGKRQTSFTDILEKKLQDATETCKKRPRHEKDDETVSADEYKKWREKILLSAAAKLKSQNL